MNHEEGTVTSDVEKKDCYIFIIIWTRYFVGGLIRIAGQSLGLDFLC